MPGPLSLSVETDDTWKMAPLDTIPSGWRAAGFDDSGYDDAVNVGDAAWVDDGSTRWIWNAQHPAADEGGRAFRKEVQLAKVQSARLVLAADGMCDVYMNGALVASHTGFSATATYSVAASAFVDGMNCISVEGTNPDSGSGAGPGGVYMVLTYVSRELAGTSVLAARCDHAHHVVRDREPTVDDDADAGFLVTTHWLQVDDIDNPAEILGSWVLLDSTAGSAVWVPLGQSAASAVSIADAGGYFTGTDVEAALQELGATPPGSSPGNLWTMSKTSSQTLTSNADTVITFDRADIDGGGSVIDLANDRFVAPATGLYLANASWMWEATAPNGNGRIAVQVNGSIVPQLLRLNGGTQGSTGAKDGTVTLALAAGDFVTMSCHPGAAVTPTARGNATRPLSTSFSLVRIA